MFSTYTMYITTPWHLVVVAAILALIIGLLILRLPSMRARRAKRLLRKVYAWQHAQGGLTSDRVMKQLDLMADVITDFSVLNDHREAVAKRDAAEEVDAKSPPTKGRKKRRPKQKGSESEPPSGLALAS